MQVVYFDVAGVKLKLDSLSDFLHRLSHVHLLLFLKQCRGKNSIPPIPQTQREPEIWFLCSGEQEFT